MWELSARGFMRCGERMGATAATLPVGRPAQVGHPAISDRNTPRSGSALVRLCGSALLVAAALIGSAGTAGGQESCIACHENREFMIGVAGDSVRGTQLWVDPEEYAATVHGSFGFT